MNRNANMDMHNDTATNGALIAAMRECSWTMRGIASAVILTFGGLVTSPAFAAVKQEVQKIQWHKADDTAAAELSAKVEETHRFLTTLAGQDQKTLDLTASHSQLHGLKSDLEALDKGAMDNFAAVESHIKTHNLPAEIEKRQQDAVKTYRSRMDTLMAELNAADTAKDAPTFLAHVNKAKAHLDQVQMKPFHAKLDPKHLPFSVAKPTVQKPRLTKKDYQAHPVAPPKRVLVAANGSLAGIISMADLTGSAPVSPSDPSYLAATDDVQITPAIQAEAQALNNDPVQIYNWVHNNVEYIPTYGSIQGSDMTLQTLKGNDFDQASLLIALLRAANIPSRYVYGTIQVPIAQVENWVGGVTDPNAALNLLGQGGVPATGLVQGGQIAYAQMEHVWVEAWVDFIPSRAAKSGPGNTWVPMDASFKQYTYLAAANVTQSVPTNSQAIVQQIQNSSTTNSQEGWVQGLDTSYIQQQVEAYNTSVQAYLQSQSSVTPQTALGSKTIQQVTATQLYASLPYAVTAVGSRSASIPASLEWQFSVQLADSSGNSVFNYTAPTATLAESDISVSWQFATQADADAWASYFPSIPSTGPYQLSDFPSSWPGYLINFVPVLELNGTQVATGSSFSLGQQLDIAEGFSAPAQTLPLNSEAIFVGEYHAIGLDLGRISGARFQQLQNNLSAANTALQSGNLAGVTSSMVVGSTLQSEILTYFAFADAMGALSQRAAGVVEYSSPSYGTFKTAASVVYLYGVPNSVSFPNVVMDISSFKVIGAAQNNDKNSMLTYMLSYGLVLSAAENLIPEQGSATVGENSQGVSAIKALALATQSGQRIYTISESNLSVAMSSLTVDDGVKSDIQDAVNSGLDVVVSQNPVSYNGFSGAGYILLDPATGIAAYRLTGGANGGFLETALGVISTVSDFTIDGLEAYAEDGNLNKIGAVVSDFDKTWAIPIGKGFSYFGGLCESFQILQQCGYSFVGLIFAVISFAGSILLPTLLPGIGLLLGPLFDLVLGVILNAIFSAITDFFVDATCGKNGAG